MSMEMTDKYGIRVQIEDSLQSHEILATLAYRPEILVSSVWEEVYLKMPLCDPEYSSVERVIEVLKDRCGDNLKIQESCGLFSIMRLTLPNDVCYLHRCPGSYYILPMYRNVRRIHTRLKPEDAADLILEFDRFAPVMRKMIEDKILERKQKQMTSSLIKSSALGIIESLKRQKLIKVPENVTVGGVSPSQIHICFQSQKVIHCRLDELEGRLLKQFGNA